MNSIILFKNNKLVYFKNSEKNILTEASLKHYSEHTVKFGK